MRNQKCLSVLGSAVLFGLIFRWTSAQDPAPDVINALAGLKTQLNTVNSTADLQCESSQMVVNLTFAKPFVGKIYAENDPADKECWYIGKSTTSFQYRIPLKKCGTKQINLREFENTLQIRFDKSSDAIELGDERKTILCRYPPPVVPPIIPIPPPIAGAVPPVPVPSVSELELLLIIAAVLFLGLLLLGLCCAWWCCKRRRAAAAKVVESEGILIEAPDVMKLSGTTLPFLDNIRIPRATASAAGSDASESALIQRLEETNDYPIVPVAPAHIGADNEILRIPHVTQLSKGYELQEASMLFPPALIPARNLEEGESEDKTLREDKELEHIAIFSRIPEGPPVPARPPSPLRNVPFGPGQRTDYEQERYSNLTETDLEHTLIAGRVPPRPPSPIRTETRSSSHMSEESITRRSFVPMPPPVLPYKLPPKVVTTEFENETNSVIESVENELIVRATPKRQRQLMQPPPPRPRSPPYYPLDTTTEMTMVSERTERVVPPRPPPDRIVRQDQTDTTVSLQRSTRDVRQPPYRPPSPVTTTRTVTKTDILREYEVFPERPTVLPQTAYTTSRETDVRREFEVRPPMVPQTTYSTTTETDIRREFERFPVPPVAPLTTYTPGESDIRREYEKLPVGPQTTYTTSTETDVRREYDISHDEHREPPLRPPSATTTTRTSRETNIHREYDLREPPGQPPSLFVGSTNLRTRHDIRSPERPPSPLDITSRTFTELNVRRETDIYPEPRYGPRPEGPFTSVSRTIEQRSERTPYMPETDVTTTRVQRETDIRQEFDLRRSPPRDRSSSPDYPNSTLVTSRDIERSPGSYVPFEPRESFTSTATRNIVKELDIGTPPDSSDTTSDNGAVAQVSRTTDIRSEADMGPPRFIPRPVLREPRTSTTSVRYDVRRPAGVDRARPMVSTYPLSREQHEPPSARFDEPRAPVEWSEIFRFIQEPFRDYELPIQSEILPEADVEKLKDLMHYDQEFQLSITRVRTVYDLYYIRYTPPYDTYFVYNSWTIIIKVFIRVLELPTPHPGDPDFIEPRPEWFSRPSQHFKAPSDTESVSTLTPSYAERAWSELTEDVPRMALRGSVISEGSEAGSNRFGSVAQRASGYSMSERSVSEYFEDVPTINYSRTYREERTSRVAPVKEAEEPASEL